MKGVLHHSLWAVMPQGLCVTLALSELPIAFQRNIFISSWVTQEPNSCFRSN